MALAVVFGCAFAPAALPQGGIPANASGRVRLVRISYRAHNGVVRPAYVVLPSWYGPGDNPPLPLVISPHGRGVNALDNAKLWGNLPARGPFLLISPQGEGRKLSLYSWGSPGQIDDLARMPTIINLTLPWVHIDHRRIYAFGGSMGGQETLLLLARHRSLLAGAAAFDAVTNLSRQYNSFARLACDAACKKSWNGPVGKTLQALARREIGGSPWERPEAYAVRSPMTYVRIIATSCVPLQLWWSVRDRIVLDQRQQTGAFFDALMKLNPDAPIEGFQGYWNHSAEMRPETRLPAALAEFGLIPPVNPTAETGMHVHAPVSLAPGCAKGGAVDSTPVAVASAGSGSTTTPAAATAAGPSGSDPDNDASGIAVSQPDNGTGSADSNSDTPGS